MPGDSSAGAPSVAATGVGVVGVCFPPQAAVSAIVPRATSVRISRITCSSPGAAAAARRLAAPAPPSALRFQHDDMALHEPDLAGSSCVAKNPGNRQEYGLVLARELVLVERVGDQELQVGDGVRRVE